MRDRGISELDRQRILLLEAFGRLIFNNDRHFGNLSFFWRRGDAELALELTPVYDMLPMRLAPSANGMVPDLSLEPAQATSELLGVWGQASELADEFWRRVGRFDGINRGFKTRKGGLGFTETRSREVQYSLCWLTWGWFSQSCGRIFWPGVFKGNLICTSYWAHWGVW